MCGVNGIVYLKGQYAQMTEAEHRTCIQAMNDKIAHRGPDGEGMLVRDPVCFGHRRLSIIDLSPEAAQPMLSDDASIAIIFNGEIYNYLEIADELRRRGHTFRTQSDTEVIIHSYLEFGTKCVKHFNGMWAFALYDFNQDLFFASRDRLGIKPFFYKLDKDRLVFSSEIKAIHAIEKQSTANLAKVYEYLAYGYKTNDGETFFASINELQSGYNLLIHGEHIELTKHWSILDLPYGDYAGKYSQAIEQFDFLLNDSIKLRFRSDVPVGILLSGGLDSSTITKQVDRLIDKKELKNHSRVNAFTAVFPGYKFDESKVVKEFISSCRNIDLNELEIPINSLLFELERIIYGFEEPVFSSSSLAHFALTREIRNRGMKVVLNGQGSDESFIGYDGYVMGYYLLDELLSRGGHFGKQFLAIRGRKIYSNFNILIQMIKAMMNRSQVSLLRAKLQEKSLDCFSREFVLENRKHLQIFPKHPFRSRVEAHLKTNLDYEEFTRILHLEDHSSMQNSVEIRSPFMDYRLIEFAFSLPTKMKYDSGCTKLIIRKAMEPSLPYSIIGNPQKLGFPTPFADWLNTQSFNRYVMEILHSSNFMKKIIWNHKKILNKFIERDKYKFFPFWRIINLELWSRVYDIQNL